MSKWNPDEHLPECGVTRYPICICDRLRACEHRVLDAAEAAVQKATQNERWCCGCHEDIEIVLTTIRALKEKP